MNVKRAEIQWLSVQEGGRCHGPPSGEGPPYYAAPVHFFVDTKLWPREAYDLVVKKVHSLEKPDRWMADVHFRAREAPQGWLADGAAFELYEGKQCVARGHIIGPAGDAAEAGDSSGVLAGRA